MVKMRAGRGERAWCGRSVAMRVVSTHIMKKLHVFAEAKIFEIGNWSFLQVNEYPRGNKNDDLDGHQPV